MARIPQAQRRIFNTTIVNVDPTNPAAIGAAAAAGQAVSQVAGAVSNQLRIVQERELAAQSAEFNSRMNLQFSDQFNNAIRSPQLQRNPSMARSEVNRISDSIINSDDFKSQPQRVQSFGRRELAKLRRQFGVQAINFENEQSFNNTVTSLNNTQNNFEIQALTTDADLNDMLLRNTAAVSASAKSGALTLNQAEQQINAASRSIVLNRAQRFINQGDLAGAQAFIADENIQEHLGADGIQRMQERIARKQQLGASLAAKSQKLRSTNPWQFVQQRDREDIPAINLGQPRNLADQIDDRLEYIGRKNEQYGVDLPVLTDQEKDSLIDTFEGLNARQSAALMNNIAGSLPDNQQDLIAQQIFKDKPSMGVAIAIADDDPLLAQSLMNGARVKKDKLIKLPTDTDIISVTNEELGEAVQQPDWRKSMQEAVKSIYADRVFTENDNSGIIQSDIVEEAVERLVGPVINVNGKDVVGFRKSEGVFLTEDEFDDFFDDLTEQQIINALGDMPRDILGNRLPLDDIKDRATLLTVGNGQYVIQLFDEWAVRRNGERYIFDLRRIFLLNEQDFTARQQTEGFFGRLPRVLPPGLVLPRPRQLRRVTQEELLAEDEEAEQ